MVWLASKPMELLIYPLRGLMAINTLVLGVCKWLGWVALALMVFVMLLQVVCRYVLDNALPWPDEAARFLMLWMTGLMAPAAYRHGGFVAIDMVPRALPRIPGAVLKIGLLWIALFVLIAALPHAWKHTMGFGGNFASSSLHLPFQWLPDSGFGAVLTEWVGNESVKVKLRYMYMSLLVGVVLTISVTVELLLRSLLELLSPSRAVAPPPDRDLMAAD